MSEQVFHDPTGRRKGCVGRSFAAFILILVVSFIVFALTLVFTPNLPERKAQFRPFRGLNLPNVGRVQRAHELDKIRTLLQKPNGASLPKTATDKIVLGFYPTWEPTALDSFRAAAKNLSHVSPAWLRLDENGTGIDDRDFDPKSNPNNLEVIDIARRENVKIVPIISNSRAGKNEGSFDTTRVNKLLQSKAAQEAFAKNVVSFLQTNRFHGINIDFEELDEQAESKLPAFLKLVGDALHAASLELSFDVQVGAADLDIKACADACDYLVLMVYDYSSEEGKSGPIAPLNWSVESVEKFLRRVPADKLVLGVGSYAYDWRIGKAGAANLSFEEAIAQADGYIEEKPQDAISFDPDSLNMHYRYADDDDHSQHEVWLLDAISVYNQWQSVRQKNLRGVGLWALGTEDPSVWKFLNYQTLDEPFDPKKLNTIDVPRSIDFTGKGELLSVKKRPQSGKRAIEVDDNTGLATDQEYLEYPFSYIIEKSGYQPKKLVLTFDDGPDPRYTPQILDELKKLNLTGTFFMVGQNCERYPDIVQRIYREGHELGNHSFTHPDLGPLGERQSDIEINATQRAIESLTGHRTRLFRPPYNADSQPETSSQVLPVDWASALGYLVVGENIDPQDWNPYTTDAQGNEKPNTAEDIASNIIKGVEDSQSQGQEGNIILLHDAGGNREETIRALGIFVPKLRALGYEFVSTAQLAGMKRDEIMPPISPEEAPQVTFDRIAFWALFTFQWLLALMFISAIGLGIARTLFLVPLAVWHNRNRKKLPANVPTSGASVTVLIAAYNEQETIEATIRSVLKSEYEIAEIVVVNDGSSDKTGEVIERLANEFPALVAISKENGGKASALNIGIERARGDLLFCIDADTQLDPKAIGRMVPYFDDPEIGAVAGNVEVGNVHNVITSWQAIEYRTSQNLDRQAYSMLNAITVVPGAIGMWRKDVVEKAGGYTTDTLAEDMDLTWRIREMGYRIDTEKDAIAYTEAPDNITALFKQRFRWAFGTLQCLWKHRRSLGRHGWFGCLALPTLWLFQVVFQVLAPIMDVKILFAVISAILVYNSPVPGSDSGTTFGKIVGEAPPPKITDALLPILLLYGLFLALELLSGWIAYRMDKKSAWRLWWLVPQRFVYRQLMYAVILRGLWRAMMGEAQGWGKLKRTGKVKMEKL